MVRIFFLPPHLFLYPILQMHNSGYLISQTHVRPAMVIEMYISPDEIPCMPDVIELVLPIDTFHLDDSVDALRNGIVGRFVVFRHADGDAVLLEKLHVSVTTILNAPVGVVYQTGEILAPRHFNGLLYSLLQGVDGTGSAQGIGQHPPDYLVGVGIRNQMQITDIAIGQGDIGNVADPKPVGGCEDHAFDKILPLVVTVVGIRRTADLARGKHQPMPTEQGIEAVATGRELRSEEYDEHNP